MVFCAVDVGNYTLEHLWSETWENRDQFDMEPVKKILFRELWEKGTHDVVGLVHDAISHVNLKLWNLNIHDRREIQYHLVAATQVHHVVLLKSGKNSKVL